MNNGWLRAFPPSVTHVLDKCQLRVSSTHFVEKTRFNKARLVTDLGNPGNADKGQDANNLSPDLEYAGVQADYINDVAEAICKDMQHKDIASEELVAIKADIKAAFMQVPIHLLDIGTLCMEFEGWIFVFVRTPFISLFMIILIHITNLTIIIIFTNTLTFVIFVHMTHRFEPRK